MSNVDVSTHRCSAQRIQFVLVCSEQFHYLVLEVYMKIAFYNMDGFPNTVSLLTQIGQELGHSVVKEDADMVFVPYTQKSLEDISQAVTFCNGTHTKPVVVLRSIQAIFARTRDFYYTRKVFDIYVAPYTPYDAGILFNKLR